ASLLQFLQLRWASTLASCERLRLWPPGALSEDTAACPLQFSHRRAGRLRPSPRTKTPPPMRPTKFLLHSPHPNPTPVHDPNGMGRCPMLFSVTLKMFGIAIPAFH